MGRVSRLTERLAPYKLGLGFACLVLALFSLLGRAF